MSTYFFGWRKMNLHRAYFWLEGDRVSWLLLLWNFFWNFLHCLVVMMLSMPMAYWSVNHFAGISAFSTIDISFRRLLVSSEVFPFVFLPVLTWFQAFSIKSLNFRCFHFVCLRFDCFDNKNFEFGNNTTQIRWNWKNQMEASAFFLSQKCQASVQRKTCKKS